MKKWARVKIPASTSNLGPGYDVLGLALKLHNEVEISLRKRAGQAQRGRVPKEPFCQIQVVGEGADSLPRDERNIVWQSAKKVFSKTRFPVASYAFRLKSVNRIPLARGLGSSAAARLGGILAANALSGNVLSGKDVLRLASQMEGHPDNVVASYAGGLCVCDGFGSGMEYVRLDPPKKIKAVVCIPSFKLSTEKARSVLPKSVFHRDAVYNVSRTAFLLSALFTKKYSLLKMAMNDRLHQTYRKRLVPGFNSAVENGYRAGAWGVALSGAGPSLFAFAPPGRAEFVGKSMEKGFLMAGQASRSQVLEICSEGSSILCR